MKGPSGAVKVLPDCDGDLDWPVSVTQVYT